MNIFEMNGLPSEENPYVSLNNGPFYGAGLNFIYLSTVIAESLTS